MYKQACKDLYEKNLRDQFYSHNEEEEKARMKKIFRSDSFAHIHDQPHAEEINDYVGNIVMQISREVIEERMDEVIATVMVDVGQFIDEAMTEEEAEVAFRFATSDLGKKILRNFDLMRDAHQKGGLILGTEIVAKWSQPEVADQIANFILDLEEQDKKNRE